MIFNLKRGQVTIFIIIGIVLVSGAGLLIIGDNYLDKRYFEGDDVKPMFNNFQNSIFDCAEKTSKEAVDVIGLQGGYYNSFDTINYYDSGKYLVPYYYYENEIDFPSIDDVEHELSMYVDNNLDECLKKIKQYDFEIESENLNVLTKIRHDDVYFEIDRVFKIQRENHRIILKLKQNPIKVKSELSSILNIAMFYTESHRQDPELYCISCIGEMAKNDDLYVDVIDLSDNRTIVIISENHTRSEPYSYQFLNKYTGDEVASEIEDLDLNLL